ncbi:MAG: GntR family transcriptional regulator [Mycobacteriaceae bacterium]
MTRSAPGRPLRRRPQLSDDVATHVRDLIMSGEVRPGDFIRLDETAADLEVSVTPVREALLTLRGEGLVELVPHKGYVVSPLTRADVQDLFWLQSQIARELTLRASKVMTPGALEELKSIATSLSNAVDLREPDQISQLEFQFHRVINRLAQSTKLSWFLLNATRYTPTRFYASDPHWGAAAVESHTKLLEHFEARSHQKAAEESAEHFLDGAHRLIAHLESIGIWD